MLEGTVFSFDCETTGLREYDRPFAMSAADESRTAYCDPRHPGRSDSNTELIARLNKAEVLIAQNAKFDLRMLRHWGLEPRGEIHDTEVLGRLVRNDHLTYSLDAQTKRYGLFKNDEVSKYITQHKLYTINKPPYKDRKEKIEHYDQVPIDLMEPYARQDARATYDLYHKLIQDLDPRSMPVWNNEVKLTKVCFDMERAGIMVNRKYTEEALAFEEGLIREAKSQFLLATGQVYDNKKTTLVDIFKKAGEEIPKTAKGNDQLTDDVLESFTSPAARLVQKIRYHEKRISTYYSSFLDFCDEQDILRADMRQAGTTTGRFSYRDPNLQNIPKEEDSTDPYVVRGCFKPRPGHVFVSMDYKQQEYRLMLAYAKHRTLIQRVMAGEDVHQATANMVGTTRKLAKTLNFAILYGAGVDKLAKMLGISREQAIALKKKYFDTLLEVDNFIQQVIGTGRSRGHVFNWLGRKLFISSREFAYALPNHLIQSGGADICKVAMVHCHDFLRNYSSRMVLQIHDALVFEMPKEEAPYLIPQLKKIMVDSYPGHNGMYMDVDVTYSFDSLAERDMKSWDSEVA